MHFVLLLFFAIIYFDNPLNEKDETILLSYRTIEKQIPKMKIIEKPKLNRIKRELSSKNIFSDNAELKDTLILSNTNTLEDSSKEVSSIHRISDLTKLDSLVINNPSLMGLKYALAEKMKTETIVETDSAFIVRRLKESLIQYYKDKYPTPLSKFGDGNSGIAIDKIIDLFSSDDIDEKKIKEYLNIK